jgi:hypothetical protein
MPNEPPIRDEGGDCLMCGTPHLGGVFDRMAVAEIIAEVLNKAREGAR